MHSLKIRILVFLSFTMLASIILLSIVPRKNFHRELEAENTRLVNSFTATYNNYLKQTINNYMTIIDSLLTNEKLIRDFAERDRKALAGLTRPLFQHAFGTHGGILQFQFHTPQNKSFYRVHSPANYDDDLSGFRQTVVDANRLYTTISGLEVGRAGLGIRVVEPVFYNGVHAGSLELGSDFVKGLEAASERTGMKFAIGIHKDVFENARRFDSSDGDIIVDNTIFYRYSPGFDADTISTIYKIGTDQILKKNDGYYYASQITLKDYIGNNIGEILVYKDLTPVYGKHLRGVFLDVLSIVFIVAFITLILFFILIKYIFRPLEMLNQSLRIDTDSNKIELGEVNYSRNDEIGQLIATYNIMGKKLNDTFGEIEAINSGLEQTVQERTAQLKESRNQLRKILDNSPVSVAFESEGILKFVNKHFVDDFGLKEGDETVALYTSAANKAEIFGSIKNHAYAYSFEVQMLNRDRKERHMLVTYIPLDLHDMEGTLFWTVDITSIRETQKEMESAKMLAEDATKAKSEFLARMSHEIRTPMNAIIGMTHLTLQTELNSKQQDYLHKIQSASHLLLQVINDILDFSKIEAGKMDIEQTIFDINEIIRKISDVFGIQCAEKGLELNLNLDENLPHIFIGDPLRITQVLTNLVSNAVKFTEQGEISISVTVADSDNEYMTLKFSVKDTGIGIKEEYMDKLFGSFSQAEDSTTRKHGGTGLGLSICKKLVELMGGTISVSSEFGSGTSFEFTVKLQKTDNDELMLELPAELTNVRVLVVDDHKVSLSIMEKILTSLSFKVDAADSGAKASQMLEEAYISGTGYKMVFLDWKMPDMDGIELTRKIRENTDRYHNPKIIMVSAYPRDEIRKLSGDVNLDSYITKPVCASNIFDTIISVFGKDHIVRHHITSGRVSDIDLLAIKGTKILLAEDNHINQQIAEEMLTQFGFVITVADNGAEALEKVRNEDFDLVLMDIQMPVMDGYTAAGEIRKLGFQRLPVIAMTANAMSGDREKSLESGMNDHINKPVDPDEMLATLVKWIPKKNTGLNLANTEEVKKRQIHNDTAVGKGLDAASGLKRVHGNTKLYYKLLNQMKEQNLTTADDIKRFIDSDNLEDAKQLAHALKGVSGNLGATALHAAAAELDKDIKSGDTAKAYKALNAVRLALDEVFATIDAINADQEAEPLLQTASDPEEIKKKLAEIEKLVDDDISEAMALASELKGSIADKDSIQIYSQLLSSFDKFDIDDVRRQISALQKNF